MFRLFLSDLLEKRKVATSFFIVFLVCVYLQFVTIPTSSWIKIFLFTIFTFGTIYTTWQTIQSYVVFDRFKSYIQLPIPQKSIFPLFILALYYVNVIERMLLTTIFAWKVGLSVYQITLDYYLFSAVIIEVVLYAYLLKNKKKYGQLLLLLFLFSGFILSAVIIDKSVFKLAVYSIGIIAFIFLIQRYGFSDILSSNEQYQTKVTRKENYFFEIFTSNRVYTVNALFVPVLIIFMLVNAPAVSPFMLLPILSTIGGINTPLTSMVSADGDLRKQVAMLPSKITTIKMYFSFLFIYFAIMNLIIHSLFYLIVKENILFLMIFSLVATLYEAFFFVFIEFKFPITNWKITSDIWKHPRKYISLVVLFFSMTIIFVILNYFFKVI